MWHLLQVNHALLEEIREINQGLIDTVVDISDEDVDLFQCCGSESKLEIAIRFCTNGGCSDLLT
jgi:hypothetical protein